MPARLPFRFGLRTLLVGIAVLSLLLAPFTWRLHRARAQADLVKRLEAAGAMVYYDFEIETEGSRYVIPSVASGGNVAFDRGAWIDFFHTARSLYPPLDLEDGKEPERIVALFDEALTDGPSWWELSFYYSILPTERLALIARQTQLRELDFDSVKFPDGDLSSLENLQELHRLNFRGVALEKCQLPSFASLPKLRTLQLVHVTAAQLLQDVPAKQIDVLRIDGLVGDRTDCRWLKTFPDLLTLTLIDVDLSDADLQSLETMEHLDFLQTDSQALTGETIEGSRLPGITYLDLSGSSLVSGKWLAEVPTLQWINVSETRLTPDALAEIDWPTGLQSLILYELTLDERTFEKLAALEHLKLLVVSPEHVEPGLIEKFAKLKPNCYVSDREHPFW